MEAMTKRERMAAAIAGADVDRVPTCFYNHNNAIEGDTAAIAPYLLTWQEKYDWDFVKVALRPSYYAEAWGCEYTFHSDTVPEQVRYTVHQAADFTKLERLDPTIGVFGQHLDVVKELNEALKGQVPFVTTVFNPISVAGRLSGGVVRTESEYKNLLRLIDEDADAVLQGLTVITDVLADYVRAAVRAGADGIFLTTSVWSADVISEEAYAKFGKPFDLAVLNAAKDAGATMNVMHICRENIFLDLMSDLPMDIINYESTSPRNPSISEVITKTNKAVWGGLDHKKTLLDGPAEAIKSEVLDALNQTGGRRFILGNGCTSARAIPEENYMAVKEAAASWRK